MGDTCYVRPVMGHYEVFNSQGCICSGDTEEEAVNTYFEILKDAVSYRSRV